MDVYLLTQCHQQEPRLKPHESPMKYAIPDYQPPIEL